VGLIMAKKYKFPLRIAELSARNAKNSYENSKGRTDYVTQGVAAYQTGDGKIHRAYDPYDPEYPAGATPGLGDFSNTLKYYPNDTKGYTIHALNFTPAAEILRNAPLSDPQAKANPVDRLRIAHVHGVNHSQGDEALIWALSEIELDAWIEDLPDDAKIDQCKVVRHMHDPDAVPQCAFLMRSPGKAECHVSDTPSALLSGMAKRLTHIDADTLEPCAALEKVANRLNSIGITAFYQYYELPPLQVPDKFIVSGMLAYGNEIVRDMTGGQPDTIEEQEAVAIHVARLEKGGEVYVEYAYDANSLKERIAHRAADMAGVTKTEVTASDALDFCKGAGIEVDCALGETCSAYGYEPSMFAFIRDGHENKVLVAQQPYEFAAVIGNYLTGGGSELDTLFLSLPDAVRALYENEDLKVDFAGIDAELEAAREVAGPDGMSPF
jgi:hypothetical protein